MERKIKNYDHYTITDDGVIYSYWSGERKIHKTYYDKQGYENVKLSKQGTVKHFLVHRLVAESFIPNPCDLPEVDHIDKNRANNQVSNLRWCNRRFNLEQSYSTMSPVRNHIVCQLFVGDELIGKYDSVLEAAKQGELLGYSLSSLRKYYHCRNCKIVKIDVTTIESESK